MARKENGQIIEEFLEKRKIYHTEGERGVKNLCALIRSLGYKDFQQWGQDSVNGITFAHSDLFAFLTDNSGAIEAIIDFIKENVTDEQIEGLGVPTDDGEDDEETAVEDKPETD